MPSPSRSPWGALFDIYGEDVTPTKGMHLRVHDRASMDIFLRFFGQNRHPAILSQRDWDRVVRERRAGRIGPSGKPVSDRMVEYDLKFLIAVLNWSARSRDDQGRLLLDRNPLEGVRTPTERNPTRVVLTEEECRTLLMDPPVGGGGSGRTAPRRSSRRGSGRSPRRRHGPDRTASWGRRWPRSYSSSSSSPSSSAS